MMRILVVMLTVGFAFTGLFAIGLSMTPAEAQPPMPPDYVTTTPLCDVAIVRIGKFECVVCRTFRAGSTGNDTTISCHPRRTEDLSVEWLVPSA